MYQKHTLGAPRRCIAILANMFATTLLDVVKVFVAVYACNAVLLLESNVSIAICDLTIVL